MSRLDKVTREELQKLWEEDRQEWVGRKRGEIEFFGFHGHWLEQGCETNCPKSRKNNCDPIIRRMQMSCQQRISNEFREASTRPTNCCIWLFCNLENANS